MWATACREVGEVWSLRGVGRMLRVKFWQVYRLINFLLIVVALVMQFVYSAQEEHIFAGLGCTNTTARNGSLTVNRLDA